MEAMKDRTAEPTASTSQSRLTSALTLVVLAVGVYWGLSKDPVGFVRILGVCLAIGLVIFLHELGHFLAAKWAGVSEKVNWSCRSSTKRRTN